MIIELVAHTGDGSYGVMATSEPFYDRIKEQMPANLRAEEHGCHAGEYLIVPTENILEFIRWFTQQGIDVIVRSCVYNAMYNE